MNNMEDKFGIRSPSRMDIFNNFSNSNLDDSANDEDYSIREDFVQNQNIVSDILKILHNTF